MGEFIVMLEPWAVGLLFGAAAMSVLMSLKTGSPLRSERSAGRSASPSRPSTPTCVGSRHRQSLEGRSPPPITRARAAVRGWTPRPVRLIMSQVASCDPPAKGIGTMSDAPRVFLSYSHDSDEHADRVLALADALSRDGCTVLFDQYVFPAPLDGWIAWMRQCLDPANSDFVLLVCTEGYLRRFEGREEPGAGRGVRREGRLIDSRLYEQDAQAARYIPILLDPADLRFVPRELFDHNRYVLGAFNIQDPGYEALYRHLTGQPATPAPKPGEVIILPPKPRPQAVPSPLPPSGGPCMSNPDDSTGREPAGGLPEWLRPIEYNEGLEDDNDEGVPDDAPGRRLSGVQSQPSAVNPRSGKPTSNYITYFDLMCNPARFDLDRLKTCPPSGGDCWYGRGEREGETLCRVPPAWGGTTRWVLIYPAFDAGEANFFTLAELESLAFGRNYRDAPVDRELPPREAAEWLERNGYGLPDDLEPAPPFDASEPPVPERLDRAWRPARAPEGGPPEPAKTEMSQEGAPTPSPSSTTADSARATRPPSCT